MSSWPSEWWDITLQTYNFMAHSVVRNQCLLWIWLTFSMESVCTSQHGKNKFASLVTLVSKYSWYVYGTMFCISSLHEIDNLQNTFKYTIDLGSHMPNSSCMLYEIHHYATIKHRQTGRKLWHLCDCWILLNSTHLHRNTDHIINITWKVWTELLVSKVYFL